VRGVNRNFPCRTRARPQPCGWKTYPAGKLGLTANLAGGDPLPTLSFRSLREGECWRLTTCGTELLADARLVVENDVEKGTANLQCVASPIINEP
jgi:hypothetical protein